MAPEMSLPRALGPPSCRIEHITLSPHPVKAAGALEPADGFLPEAAFSWILSHDTQPGLSCARWLLMVTILRGFPPLLSCPHAGVTSEGPCGCLLPLGDVTAPWSTKSLSPTLTAPWSPTLVQPVACLASPPGDSQEWRAFTEDGLRARQRHLTRRPAAVVAVVPRRAV